MTEQIEKSDYSHIPDKAEYRKNITEEQSDSTKETSETGNTPEPEKIENDDKGKNIDLLA